MFYGSGKDDERLRASESLELAYELIQMDSAFEKDLQYHGVIAGNTVTFNDIHTFFDKRIKFLFVDRFYFQINKCLNVIS